MCQSLQSAWSHCTAAAEKFNIGVTIRIIKNWLSTFNRRSEEEGNNTKSRMVCSFRADAPQDKGCCSCDTGAWLDILMRSKDAQPGGGQAARKAHVGDTGAAGGVDEHIAGLEVTVQDGRLGSFECLHALRHPQGHPHLLLQAPPGRPPAILSAIKCNEQQLNVPMFSVKLRLSNILLQKCASHLCRSFLLLRNFT